MAGRGLRSLIARRPPMANQGYDKLWIAEAINKVAIARAEEAIQRIGKALPCRVTAVDGTHVTVAFEVNAAPFTMPTITIPKAESPWFRSPTQVGDFGLTIPSHAYLNSVNGQGGASPNLARPGNLSALVWVPVGSTAYGPINNNAIFIQGPEGVVMQTQDGSASVNIGLTGITLTFGGKVVTLNGSGLTIDGILFDTHEHTGVTIGADKTGGPASP
jgi:hypothetical protein